MPTHNDKEPLRITAEDLAGIVVPVEGPAPNTGSTDAAAGNATVPSTTRLTKRPSWPKSEPVFCCRAGFYLGAAGLLGAMIGWDSASLAS